MANPFNFGNSISSSNNLFGKSPNIGSNMPIQNSNNSFSLTLGSPTTNQFVSNASMGLFGTSKASSTQSIGSTFGSGNVQNSQGTFGSFGNSSGNTTITQPGSTNNAFQFNKPGFGSNTGSMFGNANAAINATNSYGNNNTGISMGTSSVFSQASSVNGFNFSQPSSPFGGSMQITSDNNTFGNGVTSNSTFGNVSNIAAGNTSKSSQFGNIPQASQFGTSATTNQFGYGSTTPLFGGAANVSSGNSTQMSSFGSSFGNTSQTTPFGVTANTNIVNPTLAAPFGNSSQTLNFGNSTQLSSFGGSTTMNSFGLMGQTNTNQNTQFGGVKNPSFFSGTGQMNSFGSTIQSPVFGSSQKTTAFGTTSQLPSFGISPQVSPLGAISSAPSFGGITKAAFAIPSTSVPFGSITAPSFCGISQTSLTLPSQSVPFGGFSTVTSIEKTVPFSNANQTTTFVGGLNNPVFGSSVQNPKFVVSTSTGSSAFAFDSAKILPLNSMVQNSFIGANTASTTNVSILLENVASITPQTSLPSSDSFLTSASIATISSPVSTLSSAVFPTIESSVMTSNSILPQTSPSQNTIPSFIGFNTTSSSVKQPFSSVTTSTPFSINNPSAPPSVPVSAAGFSFNSGTTSASVTQSSQSIFGTSTTGLGGTTTSKPTFTSPLAVSSTTAKKGLGGSPISNSTSSHVKEGQKDSANKQVKDAELPIELKETVDAFKKFTSEQKKMREEIVKGHDAINLIVRVDEECHTLKQSISEVCNGLLKVQSQCINMRNNMLKEQSNVKVAQTNADSSFGVASGTSESASYFANKSRDFENRIGLYRQEIEVVESLTHASSASVMTTRELVGLIRNMDDEFIGLAAKLYGVHERVKAAKNDYLRRMKHAHNYHNPFLAIEGRYGESRESSARVTTNNSAARVTTTMRAPMKISDCVGSSPFDSTAHTNFAASRSSSLPQPALFGFNNSSSPSIAVFGSTGPGVCLATSSNISFNRPVGLFSTDGGSNKKRR